MSSQGSGGAPGTAEVRSGTELGGYRIESVLGRGGMGVVYLAEDLSLGRRVALKLLAPELAEDARFRERFVRESRLAASLEHPNIVPIFEARETQGRLYIAMRFVEGTDLKSLIRQEGPLDLDRTLSVLSQVAAALDAAHAQGLIHRDVKPGNILIASARPGATEHVYLSDFGLTKRVSSDSGITATGQFIGTLDYAAPEQFEGKPLDARTDVYSLGCVMYECLTGEVPFPREQDAALMYAHLLSPPPAVSEKRPDLPGGLDQVLARAIAKSPDDRFPTCGELMAAARAETGQEMRPVTPSRPVAPGAAARRWHGRSRAWLGAGIAVLVAAVVVVVVALAGGGSQPKPTGSVLPPAGPAPQAGSLVRIDPGTGRTQLSVKIGGSADAVATGDGSVWVADRADNVVVRLDPATGREQGRVSVAGGPVGIALDESIPGVWVMTGSAVWRIDPVTDEVTKTIPLDAHPTDIAIGEGAVWLSVVRLDQGVIRVDPTTGLTRDVASLAGNLGADGVAVGEGAVWVIGSTVGTLPQPVVKIDAATGQIHKVISTTQPTAAIASGDGAIWVLAPNGLISRIDPRTDRSEVIVDAGSGVRGLAAGEGSVWVIAGHTLVPVDPEGRKTAATIDLQAPVTAVTVGQGEVWVTTTSS